MGIKYLNKLVYDMVYEEYTNYIFKMLVGEFGSKEEIYRYADNALTVYIDYMDSVVNGLVDVNNDYMYLLQRVKVASIFDNSVEDFDNSDSTYEKLAQDRYKSIEVTGYKAYEKAYKLLLSDGITCKVFKNLKNNRIYNALVSLSKVDMDKLYRETKEGVEDVVSEKLYGNIKYRLKEKNIDRISNKLVQKDKENLNKLYDYTGSVIYKYLTSEYRDEPIMEDINNFYDCEDTVRVGNTKGDGLNTDKDDEALLDNSYRDLFDGIDDITYKAQEITKIQDILDTNKENIKSIETQIEGLKEGYKSTDKPPKKLVIE